MEKQELQDRIAAFPHWDYVFQFEDGVRTPPPDAARVNRHEQRRRYFFEPLLALSHGSLAGRRVLDLGCGAGFWALEAIEAGAESVLGIDVKREYLEQAELVFAAKGIDPSRYSFQLGDVLTHDLGEGFDVVLCLGVLDQVSKPVELFERMAATAAELILIDTAISRARASIFEVSHRPNVGERPGGGLVLIPSRDALADIARGYGFRSVPLSLDVESWNGMDDYRRRRRLAFLCSRTVDLGVLPTEGPPSRVPWWIRDPRALSGA
ncbi:MAG TPA: class I SAM-dependent methyltransferase [Solirubrobacteraceae bacterium]|nr:class I SAM-dependent methyltransferase [Solirubrobacteraceae bacterium]